MVPTQYRKVFINSQVVDNNYMLFDFLDDNNQELKITANISFKNISNMFDRSGTERPPYLGHLVEANIKFDPALTQIVADKTFNQCSYLKKVTINPQYITEAYMMFFYCDSLISISDIDDSLPEEEQGRFTNLQDGDMMFFYDPPFTPQLKNADINMNFPNLIKGRAMFIGAEISLSQAKTLIDSLKVNKRGTSDPNKSDYKIGITISGEQDTDGYLQNTATAKGWTLTLDYK